MKKIITAAVTAAALAVPGAAGAVSGGPCWKTRERSIICWVNPWTAKAHLVKMPSYHLACAWLGGFYNTSTGRMDPFYLYCRN